MSRDVLYCNAVIHTGRDEHETFGAMRVHKGKIAALYPQTHPQAVGAAVSDLGGQHVYPCLIDAHLHLLLTVAVMAMGFSVCEVTAEGVRPNTIEGAAERLRAYAAGKKQKDIIACNNYILTAMDEQRMPTRRELDDWCGGRPTVIYNIDGHSTSLSTAMLKLLGMDAEHHSGILQGEENERTQGRIISLVGRSITLSALAKGAAVFQNTCAAYGIGTVAALEGNGDSEKDPTTGLIVRLARRFDIGVRLYLQYTDLARVRRFRKYMTHPRVGGCGDWEMDGAAGSHSAAFSVPYLDTGTTAPCYYTQKFVDSLTAQAVREGYQIASHAIGECAIERLLTAYDKSPSPRLNRLEHCEFPNRESLEKILRGRYAVVMQPGYAWIDKRYLHTYDQYLPQEIRDRMKLRTLYRGGVCVVGSSDSPVQDMDPYLQMLGMTQFYNENESLTPYEAFRCYTVHAAEAIEESDRLGTLEVGKTADFFTAQQDFFALPPEQVVSFRPTAVWYGGKAYRQKKGTAAELIRMLLRPGHKI